MRKVFIFTGLLIVALGATTLFAGKMTYKNWFGENVFAPYALGIGLLAVGIGISGPIGGRFTKLIEVTKTL